MAEVTFKLRTGDYRYPVIILLGDLSWWSWSVAGWVLERVDANAGRRGWQDWPNIRG